jgi:hypothetical protein
LSAEDSASTASAAVPPNTAAMSAPCLIRPWVVAVAWDMDMPAFFICEPMIAAICWYWLLDSPTAVAAPCADLAMTSE